MSSYGCAGVADSPLRRAGMVPTSPPAAALFYAGEIPAVSYPNSDGGKLQVISFQRGKAPISDRNNGGNRGKGNKPTQTVRTPAWGISGQMSGPDSPAAHIEQNGIEWQPHKKGTNQAAKNHPPKSRMGHGMGHDRKAPETTDKQKRPETA